ncbi:Carboxypeptidase 3 [Operophtera brumata]|uniref:Carboxypeptidase 3 n=1 Tax=Operophtera brumata TaxID=104452 RepID=A0A0L7LM13_OPEBR|nr:Carboxypeptidase 3 [Operophtera brumata]
MWAVLSHRLVSLLARFQCYLEAFVSIDTRFMFNEEFFGGDGSPIFILIGGEWAIVAGWLQGGNMYEMARENRGYQIYTEHRYYGLTLPYTWRGRTAATRYTRSIATMDSRCRTHGAGEPRLPDIHGASLLWTHAALHFIGELRKVPRFAESEVVLYGGSYAANMALWFKQRLCVPLDYDNRFTLGYFSGLISWTFSTSVQQAIPGSLLAVCNNFATTAYARAWYYQTCTEYGYYQTAPRIGTPFDALEWLSVEFYVDLCKRIFDERFDEQFVYDAVERVNNVFGALQPDVNNTINIHGAIDPWKALGVHDRDLKDSASHCFDMRAWGRTDTIQMTRVQQTARRIVASWLSN